MKASELGRNIAAHMDMRQTANDGYKAEWYPVVVRTINF